MSLDCSRGWVFPAKGWKCYFGKGNGDPSCYLLVYGRNAERALRGDPFTPEQTRHLDIFLKCTSGFSIRVLNTTLALLTILEVLFAPQLSVLWLPSLCLAHPQAAVGDIWPTQEDKNWDWKGTSEVIKSCPLLLEATTSHETFQTLVWFHLETILPSLLLLRACLSSHGNKPSSNFQPKSVQGSLGCV